MSDTGSGLKTWASCGAVDDSEDGFCPTFDASAPLTTIPVMAHAGPAAPTPDQLPAKKHGFLIAAAVVVVLVIGGVVYFVGQGTSAASASPTSLGQAVAADFNSGNYSAVCGLTTPAGKSSCQSSLRSAGSTFGMVSFKNMKVVLVRTSGSKSLVFLSGKVCKKNSDVCQSLPPAGSMASESFGKAYKKAVNGTNGAVVAGLVQQGGNWYISGNGFGG
jgi:hypothetical protein